MAFREHPETASYAWEYTGGCYENGNIAIYEKGEVGKTYDFTFVPIEVREDESFFGGISVGSSVSSGSSGSTGAAAGSGGGFFSGLTTLFFILTLLCGLGFGALFGFSVYKMGAGKAYEPKQLAD